MKNGKTKKKTYNIRKTKKKHLFPNKILKIKKNFINDKKFSKPLNKTPNNFKKNFKSKAFNYKIK